MKPGDLICYNAAGQRRKTLGLLLRIDKNYDGKRLLLICWGIVGDLMPRVFWDRHPHEWGDKTKSGTACWHEDGGWFEVSNED